MPIASQVGHRRRAVLFEVRRERPGGGFLDALTPRKSHGSGELLVHLVQDVLRESFAPGVSSTHRVKRSAHEDRTPQVVQRVSAVPVERLVRVWRPVRRSLVENLVHAVRVRLALVVLIERDRQLLFESSNLGRV